MGSRPDIIDISYNGVTDSRDGNGYGRAISFNYILQTGQIPAAVKDQASSRLDDIQYIDFASDDPYTRAMASVRDAAIQKISQDPALVQLLAKDSWSKEDRISWERGVSSIISAEADRIPGLNVYRVDDGKEDSPIRRVTRMNDISQDMTDGTTNLEFDCESMTTFEGTILQQVENKMLPAQSDGAGMKYAADYFYMKGRADQNLNALAPTLGHIFIMSPLTNSIIESTIQGDNSPYFVAKDPGFTFDDFLKGGVGAFSNGDANVLYGSHATNGFTQYKFDHKLVPEALQYGSIEAMIFDRIPADEAFRAQGRLWPETIHLSELKEGILVQRQLMERSAPGSETYNASQDAITDMEQDFSRTLFAADARGADAIVGINKRIGGPQTNVQADITSTGPQLSAGNQRVAAAVAP